MKSRIENFFIVVCGTIYGFVSVYWVSIGLAFAFNLFGEDNGRYEEYEFLQPYGWILIVLFALGLLAIVHMLKKHGKLMWFFAGGIMGIIVVYVFDKIISTYNL